eukprot:TRINITY_DN28304_c0_g1_i1.p1 TRINITY_DN28304_c0_g1~~TRINITY_DN28304_c0_g1_i1.p1  ORF type:complete len:307 (-),score=56.59 TRINITY_DN28304_c0_g1_i1:137-919(-)
MISGMVSSGWPEERIWVSDLSADVRASYYEKHPGVNCTADSVEAIRTADVVLLAVKPQILKTVVESCKDAILDKDPLVISVAAGIRMDDIVNWLDGGASVARVMPNTPCQVREGAAAICANDRVTDTQRRLAETIMASVCGCTVWVEGDAQMDIVTAISGSGPAYFFLLIESMIEAGVKLGLPREITQRLAVQTAYGAAKTVRDTHEDPKGLRLKVTSKGGTTEKAINTFEDQGLRRIVGNALEGARTRSQELAEKFGSS